MTPVTWLDLLAIAAVLMATTGVALMVLMTVGELRYWRKARRMARELRGGGR
jgi:predicted transcriptional regulator